MSRIPSASKLKLASICPGSHVLEWEKNEKPTPQAVKGNKIHAYLEHALEGKNFKWKEHKIPPYLQRLCLKIDLDEITRGTMGRRTEVAYVYDPATFSAREIGAHIGRDYDKHGRKHGEIAGSADHVARLIDGTPVVEDFKTGRHVGAIRDNAQMRLLALMVSHVTGWPRCEGRIGYIDWYGNYTRESYMFDAVELSATETFLEETMEGVVKSEKSLKVIAGEHCDSQYCPARKYCPAYMGVAA